MHNITVFGWWPTFTTIGDGLFRLHHSLLRSTLLSSIQFSSPVNVLKKKRKKRFCDIYVANLVRIYSSVVFFYRSYRIRAWRRIIYKLKWSLMLDLDILNILPIDWNRSRRTRGIFEDKIAWLKLNKTSLAFLAN